jgi:hypothetical protein
MSCCWISPGHNPASTQRRVGVLRISGCASLSEVEAQVPIRPMAVRGGGCGVALRQPADNLVPTGKGGLGVRGGSLGEWLGNHGVRPNQPKRGGPAMLLNLVAPIVSLRQRRQNTIRALARSRAVTIQKSNVSHTFTPPWSIFISMPGYDEANRAAIP